MPPARLLQTYLCRACGVSRGDGLQLRGEGLSIASAHRSEGLVLNAILCAVRDSVVVVLPDRHMTLVHGWFGRTLERLQPTRLS